MSYPELFSSLGGPFRYATTPSSFQPRSFISQPSLSNNYLWPSVPKDRDIALSSRSSGSYASANSYGLQANASITNIRDVLPAIPVVVISDREDWSAVLDALYMGVRAYFPSNLDPDILLETLLFVHRGGSFVPHHLVVDTSVHRGRTQSAEREQIGYRGLTPGEQRVLERLRRGQSNKVIARELKIEESTVKVHVRRIMKKLSAANRTQAALLAQQMVG
jgi:DNA-binding NarL/FixJ family response regulator